MRPSFRAHSPIPVLFIVLNVKMQRTNLPLGALALIMPFSTADTPKADAVPTEVPVPDSCAVLIPRGPKVVPVANVLLVVEKLEKLKLPPEA